MGEGRRNRDSLCFSHLPTPRPTINPDALPLGTFKTKISRFGKLIWEIFACGIQNPGFFCLWNLESWALESIIQLQESGIPLRIGIQNPSSTGKELGIHRVESSIQVCFYYLTWGDFLFIDFSIHSIIFCHSVLC